MKVIFITFMAGVFYQSDKQGNRNKSSKTV